MSKFKAFADDNLKVAKMAKFVCDKVENVVGKREMLVTSIFSFSHNVFKIGLSYGREKSGLCGEELTEPVERDYR